MLNYFREAQEARLATPARRMYGYVSAGIVVAVMALVIAGLAPLWISWATFAASCVLDAVLTRNWIREDALQAYRREYPGWRCCGHRQRNDGGSNGHHQNKTGEALDQRPTHHMESHWYWPSSTVSWSRQARRPSSGWSAPTIQLSASLKPPPQQVPVHSATTRPPEHTTPCGRLNPAGPEPAGRST